MEFLRSIDAVKERGHAILEVMSTVVLPAVVRLQMPARFLLDIRDVPERADFANTGCAGPPEKARESHQRVRAHRAPAILAVDGFDILAVEVVAPYGGDPFRHE